MTEYKLPDPRKWTGKVSGLLLLGGVGLAVYYFLLPILLTIVWGTIELAIAAVIAFVLFTILSSPKFWKRLNMIIGALGEMMFKWFVEMNPFTIMEMQVDKSAEDRADLKRQIEKMKGEEDKLKQSLVVEKENLQLAAKKMQLCKEKIGKNPDDFELPLQLESSSNDWNNSNDYIQKVEPVHKDIVTLVTILDKSYRKSGYALNDAKNTIRKMRATHEAVTTGSSAMKKALRAFTGDDDMNKAADMALEALKKDISAKVGAIKNSIELTTGLMNERDLNDAAKVTLALEKAETIDATFEVLSSVTTNPELQRIPSKALSGNKWIDTLKK